MTYELPDELIPVFEKHYNKGSEMLGAVSILKGKAVPILGFLARRKGRKAIEHFEKCLNLIPRHWPTLWLMGKAYQGLGNHTAALACFVEAHQQEPNNPDVVREASIAAMDAGQPEQAATYSAAALALSPDDAGLMCNHAINLLVVGNDQLALELAAKAVALAPEDEINQQAQRLIQSVATGKVKRPTWPEIN